MRRVAAVASRSPARIASLLLAGILLAAPLASPAQLLNLAPTASDATAPAPPANLAAAEVEGFVAPLTDAQTRVLLMETLREKADATKAMQSSGDFLDAMQRRSNRIAERIDETAAALIEWRRHFSSVYNALTDYEGWPVFRRATLVLVFVLVLGVIAERLVRSLTRGHAQRFETMTATGFTSRCGVLALRLGLSLVGLLVFSVVAYGATFLFFERYDPLRAYVGTYVLAVALTRLAAAAAQFLFAPGASGLRLFHLDDEDARRLSRSVVLLAGVASFGILSSALLGLLGLERHLWLLVRIVSGLLLVGVLCVQIWRWRQRVRTYLESSETGVLRPRLPVQVLAQTWHLLVIVYLLLNWGIWAGNVLLGQFEQAQTAATGLVLVLLLPVADRTAYGLLALTFGRAREHDEARRMQIDAVIRVILGAVRLVLVIAALAVLAQAWGGVLSRLLESEVGRAILAAALNIGVSLLLAWTVWQMIRIAIDRHLPSDEDMASSQIDEDAQRPPLSRAETLLPLARRIALIALVTMVVMVVLSSLGVNIGPLLAGAGVVGLAVGFGAQKLVQDMFSGIFFLVDDAFRVGEYIEAGGVKGTVETISLRSMQLRHHRGPVQTIPYSEIQAVKNHSRDWVIMKLELRLPYDTDVDRVRKIIKNVGQQMLEDEEMGPSFLQPLKSQGVFRMEESALIVRMKFTSLPNQQWVLRREAFRRVQEALFAAGIHFAHREVTVHVASGGGGDRDAAAGGGAALTTADASALLPAGDDR